MSDQSRANRRHRHELAKQRALKICKSWGNRMPSDKVIGRLATTPTPCSCPACGNVRRNRWAPKAEQCTMQERRQANSIAIGLQETSEDVE